MATFLLNRLQNRVCRLNGIAPSSNPPEKSELRQSFGEHVVLKPEELPPKVDLRPNLTPVEDQSQIGSCTANTMAGAYEYLSKKSTGQDVDFSRLFIYYNARVLESSGGNLTDSGCSMTSAIQALEQHGVCPESDWPYDIQRVHETPPEEAFQTARDYQITEALQLDVDILHMKSCLAQGYPFAFGLTLFQSFDRASKSGVVPMPDPSDQGRGSHGSHAMLAVGYSDHSKSFIVRNSWGEFWGDKGYCYIPYDYMTNPELCFDTWTIRQFANDDFDHSNWDNEDAEDLYHSEEPEQDENPEETGTIEQYESYDAFKQDMQRYYGDVINSFFSMGFS